jgi:hypothetical protein
MTMSDSDQRMEQRHAIEELRDVQNDVRLARLRILSAVQKLEDLGRPDLISLGTLTFLADSAQHVKEVQVELRLALASVDIDAPLPVPATV